MKNEYEELVGIVNGWIEEIAGASQMLVVNYIPIPLDDFMDLTEGVLIKSVETDKNDNLKITTDDAVYVIEQF